MIQGYRYWMAISCGLVFMLAGCGGGSGVSSEEVDYSQLPPEEYVHVLAASGSLDSLKTLLEGNPQMLQARSVRNRNLLHTAALNGQDDVVKYLLSMGLDPTEADDLGSLPSELAVNEGHTSTSRLINETASGAGAPVN